MKDHLFSLWEKQHYFHQNLLLLIGQVCVCKDLGSICKQKLFIKIFGNLSIPQSHSKTLFRFDPTVNLCNEEKSVQLHVLSKRKPRASLRCWPPPNTRPRWGDTVPENQRDFNKRKLNTDAITQILELTFKKSRAVVETITDNDVTKTVLQKFTFLNNGMAVSNTNTIKWGKECFFMLKS